MFTTSKKLLIAATVLSPLALISLGANAALAQNYGPARPDQGYTPPGSWAAGTTSASGGGWGVPYTGDDGCTYQDFIEFDDNGQPHVTQHVQTWCPPPPTAELTPGEADNALRMILGVPSAEVEKQVQQLDKALKDDPEAGGDLLNGDSKVHQAPNGEPRTSNGERQSRATQTSSDQAAGDKPSEKATTGNRTANEQDRRETQTRTARTEQTGTTRATETRAAERTPERSTTSQTRAPHATEARVSRTRSTGFTAAGKTGGFGHGGTRMGGLGGMRMAGLGGMRMGGFGGMHMGGFGRR